jgi:16S rRNA (cytosine1402-N4)-methyltransferase
MSNIHQPVLLREAIAFLEPAEDKTILDATFGRGGHSAHLLAAGASVIALDVDAAAIEHGLEEFAEEIESGQLTLVRSNFDRLTKIVAEHAPDKLDGVLFDFGTSMDQLKNPQRGFSFEREAFLDMRMDERLGVTAFDLLNALSEKQLQRIFSEYGGEEESRTVAKAIGRHKDKHGQPPKLTTELAELISRAKRHHPDRIHPATKVFQALRIAVNTELDSIEAALPQAKASLKPGGVLVTIAFHEGEDRPAKHLMRDWEQAGDGETLTDGVVTATEEELHYNPAARSAKLRAWKKAQ